MRIRAFVIAAILASLLGSACSRSSTPDPGGASPRKKVVVIGFDGMDPRLCERLMDAGELPNLDRLRREGGYRPLGTTIPPQSPVAWASFITGANPGVHGIFDFIHRNPEGQYAPFYAGAETVEGEGAWEVGAHRIPLTFWPFNHNPTQTLLRRQGIPFWDYLDQRGIETRVYDIPADYPPSKSAHGHHCCLSGMGTPDLTGGYGTYQHFAQNGPYRPKQESGGIRQRIRFQDNTATIEVAGPANAYSKTPEPVHVELLVHRDVEARAAMIEAQGQRIVVKEGGWSDWLKLDFRLAMPSFVPDEHLSGICKFYLQEASPNFRLYASPVNIDPSDPAIPISEPPEFVERISDELGLFYTTGFQEDRNARKNDVFSDAEYQEQADDVLRERLDLLEYAMGRYEDGLLFFYFSSTDLQAHFFWWDSDEPHPVRPAEEAARYNRVIEALYRRADGIIGTVLERYGDEALVLVMSDHGFANFKRQFNLNRWLRENGYIQPPTCRDLKIDVDWSKTTAYGLGLNGLYLNLKGRERDGIVAAGAERDALIQELVSKLEAVRDENGQPVIKKVDRTDEVYFGPATRLAPDLIVGYHRGYRSSWTTALGEMPDREPVISDNDSSWSADHCMAAEEVPGVIFSNRPITAASPSLIDLAPTILSEFGVPKPLTMQGSSLFVTKTRTITAAN